MVGYRREIVFVDRTRDLFKLHTDSKQGNIHKGSETHIPPHYHHYSGPLPLHTVTLQLPGLMHCLDLRANVCV